MSGTVNENRNRKERNTMSVTLEETNVGESGLQRFCPTDSAIAEMASQYMPLAIQGVDDSEGYQLVHAARMSVRGHRVAVEKVRKELKADALKYGRKVDAEAKRITALLMPIEDHLAAEEDAYISEKERIRNAERLAAEAAAKAEADRIKAEQEAEAARIKAEQEAEAAKLRTERERLAEEQRRLDEQRRQMEAEKKRLADIEAARQREIENERIRAEAAEKARIETERRIEREAAELKARADARAAEAKARADAEAAAKSRAEALRPDKEKLMAFAGMVGGLEIPTVSDDSADAVESIRIVLNNAAKSIRTIIWTMG